MCTLRRLWPALLLLVGLAACETPLEPAPELSQDQELQHGQPIPGKYIVVLDETQMGGKSVEMMAQSVLLAHGLTTDALEHVYHRALVGFSAEIPSEHIDAFARDPRIRWIEPDRYIVLGGGPPCGTPKNPCGGDGGGGGGAQETPWGVTRVGGPLDGTGKTAWIIDTGVDLDHPDLNVDVARSATFITQGPDSKSADDLNGHGTHVAGTIAALNNDRDVVGVAAGATVVAVKVLDRRGSGSYSGVIAGVDYVAAHAAPGDVANMSLGGPPSDALDTAVKNAAAGGIFFAIAAGNDSDDANNYSPARVEAPNVWVISAHDASDVFASFSNYGNPPIDFAAPGVSILSLYKDGGTRTLSGTSMAAPHAAAILLLTGGKPGSDGTVSGDPDGTPDPIIHY